METNGYDDLSGAIDLFMEMVNIGYSDAEKNGKKGEAHMTSTLEEIRKSICSEYDFEEMGIDEYFVHTGMYYDDGDEFHIVMRFTQGDSFSQMKVTL